MQTFLPWPDVRRSLAALDRRRLGKQRLEARQILDALLGRRAGWARHPAARMWRGHEAALAAYGLAACEEWRGRGYLDTLAGGFAADARALGRPVPPPWLGDEAFHRSHRANLVRKDPAFYAPAFGALPPEPYVWPAGGPPSERKKAAVRRAAAARRARRKKAGLCVDCPEKGPPLPARHGVRCPACARRAAAAAGKAYHSRKKEDGR